MVVCCDNRGAMGAVIRGSCVTEVGRALSSALWAFAALHGLAVWVEYVASALNSADPPSRVCPLVDKPVPESSVNMGVPGHFRRTLESWEALYGARLVAFPAGVGFEKVWPCPQDASSRVVRNQLFHISHG